MPFYGLAIALQILSIVSRSPVPFYGPSIAFTDHSYRLQVTCTFLRTIQLLLQIIPIISRSSVPFYGPSIAFTDHSYRLQSPVPFYGPSIALTHPFYRLQVTCTFLRTIHRFYRSFLSSPGHLYLSTYHPLY